MVEIRLLVIQILARIEYENEFSTAESNRQL